MDDFDKSYKYLLDDEGGFNLHLIQDDSGCLTYAGITKKNHPDWNGWIYINKNELNKPLLRIEVQNFYRKNYWNLLKADYYNSFQKKNLVFNFAVNVGNKTAIKILQKTLNITADGIIGPITLKSINDIDNEVFADKYTLAKITKYSKICNKKSSQKKFLLGWINRTMRCYNQS